MMPDMIPTLAPELARGRIMPGLTVSLRSSFVEEPQTEIPTWFLAGCNRCGPGLAEPFRDEFDRDLWAIRHTETTGHLVHLSIENAECGTPRPSSAHPAALIRCFSGSMWRWLCPSESCAIRADGTPRWNGPYDTGLQALASWRAHGRTS